MIEPRVGSSPASTSPPTSPVPAWARNRSSVILLLLAVLIGLCFAIWSLAYRMGHQSGQQSVLQHTDPEDAAVITGQKPSSIPTTELPPANPPSATPPPAKSGTKPTAPNAGMPAVATTDPRKPGFNYLEICLLTWKDAEPAVRFLQAAGVRATAVPTTTTVDLKQPKPNDRFLILVDQGFPSGEGFRASQAERNELVAKIRRLGKQFQSEKRGASDFAEPMWRLQRGGK